MHIFSEYPLNHTPQIIIFRQITDKRDYKSFVGG